MGKISALLPQPVSIPLGEGSFEVKGIQLEVVVKLLAQFQGQLRSVLEEMRTETDEAITTNQVNYGRVLQIAPDLVSAVIAEASGNADDPEELKAIKALPAGVQIAALEAIFRLTFPEPKKLWGMLSGAIAAVKKDLLPLPKKDGGEKS